MTTPGPVRLRFTFADEHVAAIAELDDVLTPKTVAGMIAALPLAGSASHAICSGSEIMMFLPQRVLLPVENATSDVRPGELAYYHIQAGAHYGWPDDASELCWFYDEDAAPSMPGGPVAVNVFGRFTTGWSEFAAICRAMRTEGAKQMRVERA